MIFYQIIYPKPLGIGRYHQIFNFVFPQFKMKVQKLHLKPETIWVRMFLRSARYYSVNRQVGAESILKLHLNSIGIQFHKLIFEIQLFNKAQYNVTRKKYYLKCGFCKKSFIMNGVCINDFLRNPQFSKFVSKIVKQPEGQIPEILVKNIENW